MSKKTIGEKYPNLEKDISEKNASAIAEQIIGKSQDEMLDVINSVRKKDSNLFMSLAINVLKNVGHSSEPSEGSVISNLMENGQEIPGYEGVDLLVAEAKSRWKPNITETGISLLEGIKNMVDNSSRMNQQANLILGKIINDSGLAYMSSLPSGYKQMAREHKAYSTEQLIKEGSPESCKKALIEFGQNAYWLNDSQYPKAKFNELLHDSPLKPQEKAEVLLGISHKKLSNHHHAELSNLYDKEVRGIDNTQEKGKINLTSFDKLMSQVPAKKFGRMLFSGDVAPKGVEKEGIHTFKAAVNALRQNKNGIKAEIPDGATEKLLKNLSLSQMNYLTEAVKQHESFEEKSSLSQICKRFIDACSRLFDSEKNKTIKDAVTEVLTKGAGVEISKPQKGRSTTPSQNINQSLRSH